jgi:hypothetical protein
MMNVVYVVDVVYVVQVPAGHLIPFSYDYNDESPMQWDYL